VTCTWTYSDWCQSYSVTLTGLYPLYVYDATPTITSVQPLSPLYPGSQGAVAIYGTNFGPAQGSIAVCRTGANPCSSSEVAGTILDWNHGATYDQINVNLTAGTIASGTYDIQLTSLGSTGSGFLQNPSGGDVPQARGQVTITVSPADNRDRRAVHQLLRACRRQRI
jgi:hypothetical protein